MGEPSLAGLLAALRAAGPYPLDHLLNAAMNAEKARFQMRGTVAVRQHAWRTRRPRADAIGGQVRLESETPGRFSAGADCRSSRFSMQSGAGERSGQR